MALNYVSVTETFNDGTGSPIPTGIVTFTPSAAVYVAGVPVATPANPVVAQIVNGALKSPSGGTLQLLATDNTGVTVEGLTGFWYWSVNVNITGVTQTWSFFLPHLPTTVDLYALANTPAGSGAFVPLSGGTMTGELVAPDVKISGLTGATAASRYVGATASGAPASGTFAVGDFVIDQTGRVWICNAAGTPGSWALLGPYSTGTDAGGFGLSFWTVPIWSASAAHQLPAQTMACTLARAVKTETINTLGIQVGVAGVTAGTGVNGLGIYSSTGTRLGVTGDMTTPFASTGYKEGTIAGGVAVTAGTYYYLTVLDNYTGTAPTFPAANMAISPPAMRGVVEHGFLSGQASFPASFTPSALTLFNLADFITAGT